MDIRFLIIVALNLVYINDAQEIDFIFHPSADVAAQQSNWEMDSIVKEIAHQDERLKQTFKVYSQKHFKASDLKSRISFNLEDYRSGVDSEDIDWDNLEDCLEGLDIWLGDIERRELYALQMLDSWGKEEGGILEGNVRWPGHYHECLDAIGTSFSGKWCQAYYGFQYYPKPFGIPVDVSKGICFPSICSEQTTKHLYRIYFFRNNTIPLLTVRCPGKPMWSSLDTIATCSIAVLLLLAFIGLVTDLVKRVQKKSNFSNNKQRDESPSSYTMSTRIILSFSPLSNAEKILDTNIRPGTLPVLDGIRFISTTWVILGHTLQMMFYGIDNTLQARKRMISDPFFQAIINATVSVDTFFLLSGLLVAYLGMKHLHRSKGNINIPLMYLQRYLRLTPAYAFMIMFSMSLYKFLSAGPAWKDYVDKLYNSCKDDWWTNLLYINNLYPVSNECYRVGWYLANDTQFFIIAPIFLLLLHRWRFVGIVSLIILTIGGMITTGVLSSLNNIQPTTTGIILQMTFWTRFFYRIPSNSTYENKFNTDIYHTPWARINVYLIGMLTGYILFVTKRKIKLHKAIVIIGWLTATGCGLAIIYGLYGYIESKTIMKTDLAAFYNAANRPVWGICVAWVIIACSTGYGGAVKTFLNWKLFIPLSRLTYSVYLIHILVLYGYEASQEKPLHFSTPNFTYTFLGTVIITFGLAFVVSLLVEWPCVGLLKLLFSPSPGPKLPVQKVQNVDAPVQSTKVEKQAKALSNYSTHNVEFRKRQENSQSIEGFAKEKLEITKM